MGKHCRRWGTGTKRFLRAAGVLAKAQKDDFGVSYATTGARGLGCETVNGYLQQL